MWILKIVAMMHIIKIMVYGLFQKIIVVIYQTKVYGFIFECVILAFIAIYKMNTYYND